MDYNEKPLGQATDNPYRDRILKTLSEISSIYEQVAEGIQIAFYQGHVDKYLLSSLYSYMSKILSLYKILKPKIEIGQAKNERLKELEEIEDYMLLMNQIRGSIDVNEAFVLFHVFGTWEDLLRLLCEELKYTSDTPKVIK